MFQENKARQISRKTNIFRKIWRALFSWNTRFEIHPFALSPTKCSNLFMIITLIAHGMIIKSGLSHVKRNQVLQIKPENNVKYFLQLFWDSKESDDHIEILNCDWNRSKLHTKICLSFKSNFKVQIFFTENNVSLFFHSFLVWYYLRLYIFWSMIILIILRCSCCG